MEHYGTEFEEVKQVEWVGEGGNGMEWNGMEWNGMEWNGMEGKGREGKGMEGNDLSRNVLLIHFSIAAFNDSTTVKL